MVIHTNLAWDENDSTQQRFAAITNCNCAVQYIHRDGSKKKKKCWCFHHVITRCHMHGGLLQAFPPQTKLSLLMCLNKNSPGNTLHTQENAHETLQPIEDDVFEMCYTVIHFDSLYLPLSLPPYTPVCIYFVICFRFDLNWSYFAYPVFFHRSIHRLMWWLELTVSASALAVRFQSSLADSLVLAACRTWPAQQSNAVQIPTEPRAAQRHITSQLISIDALI